MSGIRIGEVTHFYDRLCVAVLKLTEPIRVGDMLHLLGHHTDFRQTVESLQIEHQEVTEAGPGQDVAMKVVQKVHPGDTVFKVSGEE
jgi:acyl-CoA hydrolase